MRKTFSQIVECSDTANENERIHLFSASVSI